MPMTGRCLLLSLGLACGVLGAATGSAGEGGKGGLSTEHPDRPFVLVPRRAIDAADLAVVVNELDPLSRRIGAYYVAKRRIPERNLIRVRFSPGHKVMNPDAFRAIYDWVKAATPANVQAYALTWTVPYRVGCMSITTAFAAGFDEAFCAKGCKLTRPSPYFASSSERPYADFGLRPSIALAGADFDSVKALIDRGVTSDNSRPPGTGYLVDTSDKARSVRARSFGAVIRILGDAVRLERIDADFIEKKPDVLFYFTGLSRVAKIETNHYRPGAIADHLTSSGGRLTSSGQMSSLRWLEAGATGSYGTVVEPCNITQKFPNPGVVIAAYVSGATLIEAYWRSVQMPGQGIFIGEPLARPFGGYTLERTNGVWVLTTFALTPGAYRLDAAGSPAGPYAPVAGFKKAGYEPVRVALPDNERHFYRIVPISSEVALRHKALGREQRTAVAN